MLVVGGSVPAGTWLRVCVSGPWPWKPWKVGGMTSGSLVGLSVSCRQLFLSVEFFRV